MYEMDEKCRKCKNNGTAICNRCDMYYDEFDPIDKPKQTNADRIRAMTDEELAEWIAGDVLNLTGGALAMATEAWLDWLKQEVTDEDKSEKETSDSR